MRAALWFRATAVILVLFAAGHTYGFMGFRPPTAEGLAVWTSMNQVRFPVGHSTYSYGQFYVGFGLYISAFYLFTAWLAWVVGSMAKRSTAEARSLAVGLLVLQCVGLGLALRYFGPGPASLSVVAVVCLSLGIVGMRRHVGASTPVAAG